MIEMHSPEELFKDDEMISIAKGQTKVSDTRKILHEKVKNGEPLAVSDMAKVNTPSRMETMQTKTRELTGHMIGHTMTDEIHKAMETFDYLAIDWVYSDELHWGGSMADEQAKKIKAMV